MGEEEDATIEIEGKREKHTDSNRLKRKIMAEGFNARMRCKFS